MVAVSETTTPGDLAFCRFGDLAFCRSCQTATPSTYGGIIVTIPSLAPNRQSNPSFIVPGRRDRHDRGAMAVYGRSRLNR